MGQAYHGWTVLLTNLPNTTCFLILGNTNDADSDGLTDAYERLVSKTNPTNSMSNLDGVLDGWEILLGLNPAISNFTSSSERANYGYTPADWLDSITGIPAKSGSITSDAEGNVKSVSQ
jgi:hypothetical protein